MKCGVFLPSDIDKRHAIALSAFSEGLVRNGHEVFFINIFNSKIVNELDLLVVFGMYKPHVKASYERGRMFNLFRSFDKNVIVIDSGYIKRDEYYMVGLNGLNNRATKPINCPTDRFEKLNVELKEYTEKGDYVLVIGQVPWDASVYWSYHLKWCENKVNMLWSSQNKNILFRPHPKAVGVTYDLKIQDDFFMPRVSISNNSIEEDLKNAYWVYTFNSNVGVDAAIAGVPVDADDCGSMIWNISGRIPSEKERLQCLSDIAYAQWNISEMKSGECLKCLTQMLHLEE